jgi:hypothetical protein
MDGLDFKRKLKGNRITAGTFLPCSDMNGQIFKQTL